MSRFAKNSLLEPGDIVLSTVYARIPKIWLVLDIRPIDGDSTMIDDEYCVA